MCSSQTCRASVKRVYDGLSSEQTGPHTSPNSTDSLHKKESQASTFQSSDRDLRAEKPTSSGPKQEQRVKATLGSREVERFCELNHRPTDPENTTKAGAVARSKPNISNDGSGAASPEVFAVKHMDRTAKVHSEYTSRPSRAVASSQLLRPNGTARAALSSQYQPLGHHLNSKSGNDTWLAAVRCKEFQEKMMYVPAEICQIIMDMVFEESFGPRIVHPHKDPPITNIFLALNKAFYRKFHQQYWTKNTWVISKGPLNQTMRFMTEKPYNETTTEFSLQTPNKAALQIRSVELSFSNVDTPHLSEWLHLAEEQSAARYITTTPSRHSSPFSANAAPEVQPLQLAQRGNTARIRRAQRYDDIQDQLIHTWQDKFDRVAMLNLRRLTLDLTEAYDPGGLYLGVNLVRRLIPFAHGMPVDFKILAPDGWIERQIRDAFVVLNAD